MGRILGSLILWTLGAVIAVAIVVILYIAWDLNQQGQSINGLSSDRLITQFTQYQHVLLYAAAAGFILGLISLIPPIVRENAERLLFWTIVGAISGAISALCIMFLYKGYWLMNSGVSADQYTFAELVAGKMELHQYIPHGAIIGAIAAALLVLLSLRQPSTVAFRDPNDRLNDPDEMIRSQRADRARRYLEERGTKDPELL
ncbi:MAG: hypothetical protein AAF493_16305 [Pseudomonadota bacterium]